MADTATAVAAPAPGGGAPPIVPWWLVLLQGIAAIIIGLLLLSNPAATTLVIVQVLGWYWLFTGVMNIVLIFVDHTMWGWKLVLGILGILAGIFVIKLPIYSGVLIPATLVLVLGIEGLIIGVVDIFKAFKGGGWGIGFLGLFSIIIGGMLLANPIASTLALPWAFGILGVIFGIVGVFSSFGMRKAQA